MGVAWGFLWDKKRGLRGQCPPAGHSSQGKSAPRGLCKDVRENSGVYIATSSTSLTSSPAGAPDCSGNKNVSSTVLHPCSPMFVLSFPLPPPLSPFLSLFLLFPPPSGSCAQSFVGPHTDSHSRVAVLASALAVLNYTLSGFPQCCVMIIVRLLDACSGLVAPQPLLVHPGGLFLRCRADPVVLRLKPFLAAQGLWDKGQAAEPGTKPSNTGLADPFPPLPGISQGLAGSTIRPRSLQ